MNQPMLQDWNDKPAQVWNNIVTHTDTVCGKRLEKDFFYKSTCNIHVQLWKYTVPLQGLQQRREKKNRKPVSLRC